MQAGNWSVADEENSCKVLAMRTRPPPLNALRTFDAAARTGSFRGAAEALHVTQSAVSHQIKFLEESLGVHLFTRTARGIELSQAGQLLHRHVQAAFAEIEHGMRALHRLTRPDELTIQTYSTVAVRWLMPRIESFQKRYPKLVIRLTTAQDDPDLGDDTCDVALLIGKPAAHKFHSTYLFTPRLYPVCTPRIAETLRKPGDLAGQPILQVYPSRADWQVWLDAHGLDNVDPDQGLRFDSYDHALRMAARSHGVALTMEPYAAEELAAGVLVRPFPDRDVKPDFHWYIASPETRAQAPHVRAFRKWVIEQVEADPELAALRAPEA
jgi:DNA-binding transcriptional LysR family regulator